MYVLCLLRRRAISKNPNALSSRTRHTAADREPPTGSRRPGAADREPPTGSRRPPGLPIVYPTRHFPLTRSLASRRPGAADRQACLYPTRHFPLTRSPASRRPGAADRQACLYPTQHLPLTRSLASRRPGAADRQACLYPTRHFPLTRSPPEALFKKELLRCANAFIHATPSGTRHTHCSPLEQFQNIQTHFYASFYILHSSFPSISS